MRYFLFFLFIETVGCASYKSFNRIHGSLSGSPCIDGIILNIYEAGCKSFYWGTLKDENILKIRCAYSPVKSYWTQMDFYAIYLENNSILNLKNSYCQDRHVKVYTFQRNQKIKYSED